MKKLMQLAVLLLVMAICLGCLGTAWAEEETEAVDYIQNVSYIDDGDEDHMLDIYGTEEGQVKPLMLEIHGGGFFGGAKETNIDHCKVYRENGFAVVAPNYTHLPEVDFITIVQELFTMMHWVEDHAEEYHFDLERVCMGGDSAGGFLVELVALVLSDEDLQQTYAVTPPTFDIKAYVVSCPEVDIMELRNLIDEGSGFRHFMAGQIQDVLRNDEVMEKVDLLKLINPETYPELYIIAVTDDKILYDDAILLDNFLTENNIPHVFNMYSSSDRYLGHVFNVTSVDYPESIEANNAAISYMKEKIG